MMTDPELRRSPFIDSLSYLSICIAGAIGALVIAVVPLLYIDRVAGFSVPGSLAVGISSFTLAFTWFIGHMIIADTLFDGGI